MILFVNTVDDIDNTIPTGTYLLIMIINFVRCLYILIFNTNYNSFIHSYKGYVLCLYKGWANF